MLYMAFGISPPAIVGHDAENLCATVNIFRAVLAINRFITYHRGNARSVLREKYPCMFLLAKTARGATHVNSQRLKEFKKLRVGHLLHPRHQPAFMIHLEISIEA